MGSRADKAAYILTVLFVLFLLIFGWKVHFIEAIGSAEIDGYVDKAELIRSGTIPKDVYRPLLYPLVSAGIGSLLNNTFAGARVASSLFAGLLLIMTYLTARACFSREVGLFAIVALALNFHVITMGLDAATDMMFAALATSLLFLSVRAAGRTGFAAVVLLSLSFALAYFTRYTAIFLLPTALIGLFFVSPDSSGKKVAVRILLFIAAVIVFLLPHFILTARTLGSPLANMNWKNVAFKMYGDWDWRYFRKVPYDGLTSVILSSPSKFIFSFLRELSRFFYSTMIFLGGKGIAGGLFAAACLAGLYRMLFLMDIKRILFLSFFVIYIVLGCAFFYSGTRFMLPVLPLCYILGCDFILSNVFSGSIRLKGRSVSRKAPVIAVFMLVLLLTTVRHMNMYVHAHPYKELEAALMLDRGAGTQLTVLGTFPFMQRYVNYDYSLLDFSLAEEEDDESLYYDRLKAIVDERGVDYIIIGRLSLANRPEGLLMMRNIPSFLQPVLHNGDVVTYKVQRAGDNQ